MLSWIQGLLDERGLHPQLPPPHPTPPPEMYSAGPVPILTRLVNGRRAEYFKLHSPPFSFLTPLVLPFLFLFGCALVKCTHDPVSTTAVHTFNLYDIMLYFWD